MKDIIKYLIDSSNLVKINSKEISQGDIFLALKGAKVHGNQYIFEAVSRGAKYIISDTQPLEKLDNIKYIIVNDTIKFLSEISKTKRNLYKGIVVGITGSIGKTSVKENLRYFLSAYCKVSVSQKSYNNFLGVIISILNLDLNSKFAIFELGTNNFLEIKKLTLLIMPSQTIITNIYETHIEKLINTKNIAVEKSDIFNKKYNPNVELAIIPNDSIDEKLILEKAQYQNIKKIFTFGKDINSDLKVLFKKKIDNSLYGVDVKYKNTKINFLINQNQIHRINNILICLLIIIFNKIKLEPFLSMIKDLPLIEGRGNMVEIFFYQKKINFIDESYNASPQSMMSCIDYLSSLELIENQKKYLILGEMKELGERSIIYHVRIIEYILEKKIENVIICGKLMELALKKTGEKKILCFLDIKSILKFLGKVMNENDILLIKGSNSSLTNELANIFLNKEEV